MPRKGFHYASKANFMLSKPGQVVLEVELYGITATRLSHTHKRTQQTHRLTDCATRLKHANAASTTTDTSRDPPYARALPLALVGYNVCACVGACVHVSGRSPRHTM